MRYGGNVEEQIGELAKMWPILQIIINKEKQFKKGKNRQTNIQSDKQIKIQTDGQTLKLTM